MLCYNNKKKKKKSNKILFKGLSIIQTNTNGISVSASSSFPIS